MGIISEFLPLCFKNDFGKHWLTALVRYAFPNDELKPVENGFSNSR